MTFKQLHIIEDNDHFIAVNKPAGLFSVPDRFGKEISLKKILEQQFGSIFTIHRLDKETSGIIVFAKHAAAHKDLSVMFEQRAVEKYYYGLVVGAVYNTEGSIDAPIAEHHIIAGQMTTHQKGKASLTTYQVEQSFKHYAWVKFQLHTGRTHQIRVHTKYIGNPIACDAVYGNGTPLLVSAIKNKYNLSKKEDEEKPILNRVALHAYQLIFSYNNINYNLMAELPKDLRATLQQLQKHQAV